MGAHAKVSLFRASDVDLTFVAMVDIERKVVNGSDLTLTTSGVAKWWFYKSSEYFRVPERTWGKIDQSSPVAGLCTDLVDTCFVFIHHCPATQRTTMLHTTSQIQATVRFLSPME